MSATPKTDAVAKIIGKLAYKWRVGEISASSFTAKAQLHMDYMGEMEKRVAELEEALNVAHRLIVKHHEAGVVQVAGCFCPVCHRGDGTEPEMDTIFAAMKGGSK